MPKINYFWTICKKIFKSIANTRYYVTNKFIQWMLLKVAAKCGRAGHASIYIRIFEKIKIKTEHLDNEH